MPWMGAGPAAAVSLLLSAAIGVLTNLVTNQWSLSVAIAFGCLVVTAAALAWREKIAHGSRTTVKQIAKDGVIAHSNIQAANGAGVTQEAMRQGSIIRSPIDAKAADVKSRAERGAIADSPTTAE